MSRVIRFAQRRQRPLRRVPTAGSMAESIAGSIPGSMARSIAMMIAMAAAVTIVSGCFGRSPEPADPRFEITTPEGLRRLESRDGRLIYLRPGVELDDFERVLVDPFAVSYANPRDASDPGPVRTLDAQTEARFTETLRSAFIEQLGRSRIYALSTEPGPDAIRVQGLIYDLVVEPPPHDDSRNFPICFAEMTLVLTVRHSETAEALARVADRIRLSCAEPHARFYTARWADVKAALRPWASFLRHWLEELHETPSATSTATPTATSMKAPSPTASPLVQAMPDEDA